MKIYHEETSDITRYIDKAKGVSLDQRIEEFDGIFDRILKYHPITPETRILEVGTGTGWIPIICSQRGYNCKGMEISPQLIQVAMELGKENGVVPDIELGNIEEANIGSEEYDIIVATSSFEHVENWKQGLINIFNGLKPGGLFFFYSTNKFSFKSGEYNFPLYGWYPDSWRYRLRITRQGEDIMKLGIDFNQFTYFQLRKHFKKMGFSTVMDRVDMVDSHVIERQNAVVKIVLKLIKNNWLLKDIALLFYPETFFICIK